MSEKKLHVKIRTSKCCGNCDNFSKPMDRLRGVCYANEETVVTDEGIYTEFISVDITDVCSRFAPLPF